MDEHKDAIDFDALDRLGSDKRVWAELGLAAWLIADAIDHLPWDDDISPYVNVTLRERVDELFRMRTLTEQLFAKQESKSPAISDGAHTGSGGG